MTNEEMPDLVLCWACAEYKDEGKTKRLWTFERFKNLQQVRDVFTAWEANGYNLTRAWAGAECKNGAKIIKFRMKWTIDEEE